GLPVPGSETHIQTHNPFALDSECASPILGPATPPIARRRAMNTKSTIATAVVGVTVLGGVAVASAAPRTASTAADDCSIGHDGPWPASVQGRPRGFDAGDKGGVYMWHDD